MKTIPPYKPVTNEAGSSDPPSSPEKESEQLPSSQHNTASTSASLKSMSQPSAIIPTSTSTSSKQRKSGGSSKTSGSTNATAIAGGGGGGSGSTNAGTTGSTSTVITNVQPAIAPSTSIKVSLTNLKDKDGKHGKSVHKLTNSKGHDKDGGKSGKSSKGGGKDSADHMTVASGGINLSSSSSLIIANMKEMNATAKETLGQKFTTSNFTETVVVNSESVFGSENQKGSQNVSATMSVAKKRKADGNKSANSSTEDINK